MQHFNIYFYVCLIALVSSCTEPFIPETSPEAKLVLHEAYCHCTIEMLISQGFLLLGLVRGSTITVFSASFESKRTVQGYLTLCITLKLGAHNWPIVW